MSNNKPDRKLNLAVETVRVLNQRPKKPPADAPTCSPTNVSDNCHHTGNPQEDPPGQ